MNFKFWQRNRSNIAGGGGQTVKLRPPKELLQPIGLHLVTKEKIDPDLAWSYQCVLKPRTDSRYRFDFRVFNPKKFASLGVIVKNFNSLDAHSEEILYYGWYDKRTNDISIHRGGEKTGDSNEL